MEKSRIAIFVIFATIIFGLSLNLPAEAANEVGKVVGLRGTTMITRAGSDVEAGLKTSVELKDVVETKERSRAKMLFIDESILTLGPNSKASIEEFVYSKEGGGASIFNLLDGVMRTVVGKSEFEVHTPTSIAAARGTVIEFFVGTLDGKPITRITCIEGVVDIRSTDPGVGGTVSIEQGETVTIVQSEPLPAPEPAVIGEVYEIPLGETPAVPPVELEPVVETTPVTVEILFPGY
jgi:hypothetical protein